MIEITVETGLSFIGCFAIGWFIASMVRAFIK